jgi:hypothetical protein
MSIYFRNRDLNSSHECFGAELKTEMLETLPVEVQVVT